MYTVYIGDERFEVSLESRTVLSVDGVALSTADGETLWIDLEEQIIDELLSYDSEDQHQREVASTV